MRRRIEEFGGSGESLVFAHANGYPVGSYRQFLGQLTPHCKVTGYHHRPMWSEEEPPLKLNWRGLAVDLVDTLEATQSGPVWMMGHSMGAVASLLAAARRPDLFRGLILIDPVFMLRRHITARELMSAKKLEQTPMVARTLKRPNRFATRQEAFDFHRPKRAFRGMSDEVMWDYIKAGTRQREDGEYTLSYGREWEAAAYRSAPSVWSTLGKVKLPVLGLRGETTDTLSKKAFGRWQRMQPQARLLESTGGHLLPLEYPAETAAHIIDFLGGQGSD